MKRYIKHFFLIRKKYIIFWINRNTTDIINKIIFYLFRDVIIIIKTID